MTNSIIHVVYEKWEPCFVPLVRDWGLPVTHFSIDSALYFGLFLSVLFVCDKVITSPTLSTLVSLALFLTYSYLRVIHFYNWNNHYYLNMLLLFIFVFIGDGRFLWEYKALQLLLGSVYVFAGISKISTAWLNGDIAETMTENHSLVLPLLVLSWGGFLLDLFGGLVIVANCFVRVPKFILIPTHISFALFHLHNLVWMFKSIQFFPLHMLSTIFLFTVSAPSGATAGPSVPRKHPRLCWRSVVVFAIVIGQCLFASRRFFILVDYPWQIWKANDIAEFHSQVHHFSWRMKSRTVSSQMHVAGKWPTLMTVGVAATASPPEERKYLFYTEIFFNRMYADPEFGVQPLVNRVRAQMPDADPDQVEVNLFWWNEVNHEPYQLLVNPQLNFVNASHIPLWGAPPLSHVEAQIVPRADWKQLVGRQMAAMAAEVAFTPFMTRAIDAWIPNPLIAAPQIDMMPVVIVCLYGEVVVRGETEQPCTSWGTPLPHSGKFHLKFLTETLFLLGFNQS